MKPVLAAAGVAVALTAFAPASQAATEFAFSNWIPWTHKLSTRLSDPVDGRSSRRGPMGG